MANEYINRLHEERLKAVSEQRGLVEDAMKQGRANLSAEEQATIERLDTVIDGHDTEIRSWQDRDQRDKENEEARAQYEPFVRPAVLEESFGEGGAAEQDPFYKFLNGEIRSVDINISAAAREKAAVRGGQPLSEFRDLTKTDDTALVPVSYARTLYDFLETYSGVRRTGATVLTTADGNIMTMPKVATHSAAAAAVAEGGPLAEADPTFSTYSLTSWKFGRLIQVSHELPRDAVADVMNFVAQDAGRALGKATGAQYILGDGSTEPEGVFVGFGSGVTGASSVAGMFDLDDLFDLMYSLGDEAYRTNAVWLTKDMNVKALRKIYDLDGRPLWEPSLKAGESDVFLGHKIITDTNVASIATSAKSIAFGDFAAGFVIRDVGNIRFESSADYAFANDLMTYRAIIYSDSAVRDTNAVKYFTGNAA